MIIYWFGYTEDVTNPCERRFIVMDNLPSTNMITHLKCNQVDENSVDDVSDKLEKELNFDRQAKTSSDIC